VNTNDTAVLPSGFIRLAWSNLAAQSAEQIGLAAAPIVAVLALGAGVGATGLLQTAQTLPFVLFAIPAGLLADRTSRRLVMTGAEALRMLSLVGILALAYVGWLLISTATLRQTVTPRALLGRVSAINITTYGARPLGAALGALVGVVYGAEMCLVVAALGFLVQAVVIVASPVRRLVHQPEMVNE
jgi:MFS family permease